MYTFDEINAILSDLDACAGRGKGCLDCSRASLGRAKSLHACMSLDEDAAALIRWLMGWEVDANA